MPETPTPLDAAIPWGKLEKALHLLDFSVLGEGPIEAADATEWEAAVPRSRPLGLEVDEDRQWGFIVKRLTHLQESSCVLAVRPDERDLLLVVGRESDSTDAELIKEDVRHVEWVIRGISRAARRLKVPSDTTKQLVELANATSVADLKLPARAGADERAAKFAFDLRNARLAFGITAVRLALTLVRFRVQRVASWSWQIRRLRQPKRRHGHMAPYVSGIGVRRCRPSAVRWLRRGSGTSGRGGSWMPTPGGGRGRPAIPSQICRPMICGVRLSVCEA